MQYNIIVYILLHSTYTRKTVSSALIQQTAAQDGHNDFSRVASATVCGVEYLLPLLMDSDNFFSSSCKVAEQFDQNIPLNHVHEGRNIDYKVHDKNKMLAPACWVDALLFFGIIKSNYTMDRQLCYRKKPRGPRGLQLSKGSFNVTSLTVHNVNITYNISSTLWEKHKLRPTLGYLPVRVFKKVYLNNSYIKSQKRRNIVEMVNNSIGPLKKYVKSLSIMPFV